MKMPTLIVFTYLMRCQINAKTFAMSLVLSTLHTLCTLQPTKKCTQN